MSSHPSRYTGSDFLGHVRTLIETALPGAKAEVSGGGGHFTISVVAAQFKGKSMLEQQRMVYTVITELMSGQDAPIHAVDKLTTKAA
ncbi:MAG TPA: BolA/IbaG family iron-sulfur metabolism protein [Pseudomonadota bacterium]|jgi:acid stress-induced BolA-like protein IbaG/YrbA|nr:BolA/IbaG family iron-sulfur metabolism protein [Pseudomonadota bacterium]